MAGTALEPFQNNASTSYRKSPWFVRCKHLTSPFLRRISKLQAELKIYNKSVLTEIKSGNAPSVEQNAVDMLLACHQRIRSFTDIAIRLTDVDSALPEEIANAAAVVHRYFSIALPLHEADENESVYPRLSRTLDIPVERASLQSMVDQHGPIDEVVARLIPSWRDLASHPEKLAAFADDLLPDSHTLKDLWRQHLALEEDIVFPLIRTRLTAADLAEIHAEMKQRRGI